MTHILLIKEVEKQTISIIRIIKYFLNFMELLTKAFII